MSLLIHHLSNNPYLWIRFYLPSKKRNPWIMITTLSQSTLSTSVLDVDFTEAEPARLTERAEAAVEPRVPELLQEAAVYLAHLQLRRVVPHVPKRDLGELAAPQEGHPPRAQEGQDVVAGCLGAHETVEGAFPQARVTMAAIRFGDYVVPCHLAVKKNQSLGKFNLWKWRGAAVV